MHTIIIKQARYRGGDNHQVRAYANGRPLGVSANSTNSALVAAQRCAVKAFIKLAEPQAEIAEIETRIRLTVLSEGQWQAELQGNVPN